MTDRKLHTLAYCPDCGSEHLRAPCGMTFAERMRSVSASTEWMPARIDSRTRITGPGNKTDKTYYDDGPLQEMFGYNRQERREKLMDETHGVGPIDSPDKVVFPGDKVVRDGPKTHFHVNKT